MTSQIPFGGEVKNLWLTQMFMNLYPKECMMCKIVNVKDPQIFRGRVKYFILAIADLESNVVSEAFFFISYCMYIYLIFFFFVRLYSTVG